MRELSSLIRCDHVILCSDLEKFILDNIFPEIFKDKISLITFFYENKVIHENINFDKRKDFIFLGNFQHKPNKDSVQFIAENLWPKLVANFKSCDEIPKLKIYGTNMDTSIKNLEKLSDYIKVIIT